LGESEREGERTKGGESEQEHDKRSVTITVFTQREHKFRLAEIDRSNEVTDRQENMKLAVCV